MARQYALPTEGKPDRSDPRGLTAYIRETAAKYGVDPEVALKVAKSEGLSSFRSGVRTRSGGEEPSFGAFQLYTGGGLGNQFQKETGLDPSDPANEKATIDYALKTAAKVGWGPWHGAKKVGVGEFEGIGGASPEKTAATAAGATPVSEGGPAVSDAPQTASGAPAGDFLTRLKDPRGSASEGLGEAISGLGQAVTGAGKGLYDTGSSRAAPIAAPAAAPAAVVPLVDPKVADAQRQQLAMAMQRLNSGRLY